MCLVTRTYAFVVRSFMMYVHLEDIYIYFRYLSTVENNLADSRRLAERTNLNIQHVCEVRAHVVRTGRGSPKPRSQSHTWLPQGYGISVSNTLCLTCVGCFFLGKRGPVSNMHGPFFFEPPSPQTMITTTNLLVLCHLI